MAKYSTMMIVAGVGLLVLGIAGYSGGRVTLGTKGPAGWSDTAQIEMAFGAMLIAGEWLNRPRN